VTIQAKIKPAAPMADSAVDRVARIDWNRVADDLGEHGAAMLEKLLSLDECQSIAGLYTEDSHFRSRIVMGRHGFGRRIQIFCLPAPRAHREPAHRALPPSGSDRQLLEPAARYRCALPDHARGVPEAVP
jgi:hypothetical protein